MKALVIILILATATSASADFFEWIPKALKPYSKYSSEELAEELTNESRRWGHYRPSVMSVEEWVRRSFKIAKVIALHASKKTALSENKEHYFKMYTANPGVVWPSPGMNFKSCTPDTAAFVLASDRRTINLCWKAIYSGEFTQQGLVQVLVHELAHIVGIDDECIATALEIEAMWHSYRDAAFFNLYIPKCSNFQR